MATSKKIPLYLIPVTDLLAKDVIIGNSADVTVIQWKPPIDYKSSQGDNYYTTLCRSLCSAETKQSIVNHISLWTRISTSSDDYAIVVEDYNIVSQLLLDSATILVKSMHDQGIDILQLTEPPRVTPTKKTRFVTNTDVYAYTSKFGISTSAYIISKSAAMKLATDFAKNHASMGLTFELAKREHTVGITRMILADADSYVHKDHSRQNKTRGYATNVGIRGKAALWLSRTYPELYSVITTPVISIFGYVDINVAGIIWVVIILMLMCLDVRSRLTWFLVGALASTVLSY